MNKLRIIKNSLKKKEIWANYKRKYKNKQMRLLLSKMFLGFNKDLSVEKLVDIEVMYYESNENDKEKMFSKIFLKAEKITGFKADWFSLSKFLWYVYQTSTYWKDTKKQKNNVFIGKEVEVNVIKNKYFFNWLHSIDHKNPNFNSKVINVMEATF